MSEEAPKSANLSREVIEHLSKEIETLTNNNMVFRSRASLSVFLGPFIVLGSFVVALKGSHISFHPNTCSWVAMSLAGCGFLVLAYISGVVEMHAWRQCNKNRELIARLHKNPQALISTDDLTVRYKAERAYFFTYSCMLVMFSCAVYVVSRLEVIDLSKQPVRAAAKPPTQAVLDADTKSR